MRKLLVLVLVLSAIVTGCVGGSTAQTKYPEKPIKLIIPFAAGGGTDVLARALAKYIKLEQPLVIVNIAGAGGATGAAEAAKAPPDGYTLLSHHPNSLIVQCMAGMLPKDLWKEMQPICAAAIDPCIFVAKKESSLRTWNEVVQKAKAEPGKMKWGGVGGGMNQKQLEALRISREVGIEVTYVPYDSAAKSRTALLGGHIDLLLADISEVGSLVKSGEVTPIAVCSKERSKCLPDVPTLEEYGVKSDFCVWRMYWAPPRTPEPIVAKLENAIKEACQNPEFANMARNELLYDLTYIPGKTIREYMERDFKVYSELLPLIEGKKQ